MLIDIFITAIVIVITTIIHAAAMHLVLGTVENRKRSKPRPMHYSHTYWIAGIIIVMFIASVLEVMVWAITYRLLAVEGLASAQEAMYFSMVTYTTLGYGDIVLTGHWRILSAFEAANGIVMFGWTTAIVFAAVQRLYFSQRDAEAKIPPQASTRH